jgi:hypothetical protein
MEEGGEFGKGHKVNNEGIIGGEVGREVERGVVSAHTLKGREEILVKNRRSSVSNIKCVREYLYVRVRDTGEEKRWWDE